MKDSGWRFNLDRGWKFIPERIVSKIPAVAKWRSEAAKAHAAAALAAADKGDYAVAIADLSEATELEPKNREYLYHLGKIYFDTDDLLQAERCFRQALIIDFYNSDSLKGLAYTLHRLGKFGEAIYCYFRYLEMHPDHGEVHANLIAALEANGRYEDAIAAGERAIAQFPSDAGLLFMLARNSYFAGKVDKAIEQLRAARTLDPENPDIHRVLGIALKTRGDLSEAIASFNEAIKRNPSDPDAYLAAADAYQRMEKNNEYLEAAQTARRLLEPAGHSTALKFACWEEGWALYKLGRWKESITASECAIKVDESLAPVRFNIGLALLRLGYVDRAKDEYRKGIARSDASALKVDAIDDLKAALQEQPNLAGASEILQDLEGRYRQSTDELSEKLSSNSDSDSADSPALRA